MKRILILTLGWLLLANNDFADVPGGGVRWPAQRIRFSNVSSLGKFALHLKYEGDFMIDTITSDTTCSLPEHGGSPGLRFESFFAISNKVSTDTVLIDAEDMDITFAGIKNNKLLFSKQSNKGSHSTTENLNSTDIDGNDSANGINKLLVGLSILAIVCLVLLFIRYKRKKDTNNTTPSI